MTESESTSEDQLSSQSDHLAFRRIRHISGIQIHNLTLFPVRDAFTSALAQRVGHQDSSNVGTIEDPVASLSRVRSRRISTTSVATRRSLKREEGAVTVEQDIIVPKEVQGRKSSNSRVTVSNISTSPSNSTSFAPKQGSSLPSHRPRTSSMTSSGTAHRLTSLGQFSIPNNSQAALEKVISCRLIETFITITILPPPRQEFMAEYASPPTITPLRSAPSTKTSFVSPAKKGSKAVNHSRDTSNSSVRSNGRFPHESASQHKSIFKNATNPSTEDAMAMSPQSNGISTHLRALSIQKGKSLSSTPQLQVSERLIPPSPIYFSSIHRPSTSPHYMIDTRLGSLSHDSTSGKTFKIELWGRATIPGHGSVFQDRVGREDSQVDWRIVDEWQVNLDKLVPLSDDSNVKPPNLPPNTLILTLDPPGKRFYSPVVASSGSMAPSNDGYTSDPESEIRKAKQQGENTDIGFHASEIAPVVRRRRPKKSGDEIEIKLPFKTVTWQELFNLVSLQSLVADTQASLNIVIDRIDSLLRVDFSFPLRRELLEREARIRELRNNHYRVLDQVAQQKQEITDRSRRLQERVEGLASAGEAIGFDAPVDQETVLWRSQLVQLRKRTTSSQTALLATLTRIFPIELVSPPDLLFTILDVPLPIPLTSNDPAPPLSLPEHREVTEDAVATALGYVAQVVQMVAAYLGRNLVYPIRCAGSRSLIRDGISAMVGPRMFPLFPKGVDAYRFEYGVFLLNKNIEMLMADRDLRALDMRHTLPNLKNLLLTLSHGAEPQPPRRPLSPDLSISGLETPSRESSPSSDEPRTPRVSHRTSSEDTMTPTVSGRTTPLAAHDESAKGKSFLGFVPFTDFLRRYPSQSSQKTVRKAGDSGSDGSEGVCGEEEDRSTLNGTLTKISTEIETLPDDDALSASR